MKKKKIRRKLSFNRISVTTAISFVLLMNETETHLAKIDLIYLIELLILCGIVHLELHETTSYFLLFVVVLVKNSFLWLCTLISCNACTSAHQKKTRRSRRRSRRRIQIKLFKVDVFFLFLRSMCMCVHTSMMYVAVEDEYGNRMFSAAQVINYLPIAIE